MTDDTLGESATLRAELEPIATSYEPAVFFGTVLSMAVEFIAYQQECSRHEAALKIIASISQAEIGDG